MIPESDSPFTQEELDKSRDICVRAFKAYWKSLYYPDTSSPISDCFEIADNMANPHDSTD
jgi:hypothetical protein